MGIKMIEKLLQKKHSAKVELMMGMFLIVFLLILLASQLQLSLFQTIGLNMEDALAASNLASAVVDIKEYGTTHILQIASAQEAYDTYRAALRTNLGLDDNWENANIEWIKGKVEVLQYAVYNVRDQDVTIYSFSEQGVYIREEKGGLGSVRTPDGTLVESTSVYSRIGFPVEGILGIKVYAEKDNTVDIIAEPVDQYIPIHEN